MTLRAAAEQALAALDAAQGCVFESQYERAVEKARDALRAALAAREPT